MITLLDALNGPCGAIIQALQVDQTGTLVLRHNRVDLSTLATLDEGFNVTFEDSDDVLVLESASQDQISLTTEVTLDVEFSLHEVKNMLRLSVDLSTDRIEVDPRSFGR